MTHSLSRFGWVVFAGALVVMTACSTPAAPPATLAESAPETKVKVAFCLKGFLDRSDFDGDGRSDIVVGMPSYGNGAGAVDIRGTNSRALLLRAGDLGGSTRAGAGFGSAIAIADLDGDKCADLVIGAPNEGAGQVYVVFGRRGGLNLGRAYRLPRGSIRPSANAEFGHSLAMASRRLNPGDARDNDLYVGAPGATVGGKAQAGKVWHYRITAKGAGRVSTTLKEVLSQDSGMPGAAEAGDRFGEVLAPLDNGGVVVGVPKEDVGPVRDAGAIWSMPTGSSDKVVEAREWSQGTAGVPGKATAGNRFGAAVGSRGQTVAVGVPGEDVGSAQDAGLVQVFQQAGDGALVPDRALTQDSPGIPGVAEAGDRFGAALVVGVSLAGHGSGSIDAAIGVPGEDFGAATDAGMIDLVPVSDPNLEAILWARQGERLNGRPEAGDAVGSVLAATRGRLDLENDYWDDLLVGVPREDIGSRTDAGRVQQVQGQDGYGPKDLTFSGGYRATRNYGQVLPSSSD